MEENNKKYDLSYLQELADGDDEYIKDMVAYFIKNSPDVLKRLEDFYKNQDYDELRNEAHKFSSNVNMIGISLAVNMIEKIEDYSVKRINLDQISNYESIKKSPLERQTQFT